jgi:hypothetical protein
MIDKKNIIQKGGENCEPCNYKTYILIILILILIISCCFLSLTNNLNSTIKNMCSFSIVLMIIIIIIYYFKSEKVDSLINKKRMMPRQMQPQMALPIQPMQPMQSMQPMEAEYPPLGYQQPYAIQGQYY